MNKTITQRALKRFYTRDYAYNLSAFLLSDGSFMDLEDKEEVDQGAWTRNDHRYIMNIFNSPTSYAGTKEMYKFMKLGHIRFMPECRGFEFIKKPTPQQMRSIRDYHRENHYAEMRFEHCYFCKDGMLGKIRWSSNDYYEFIEYVSKLK